MIYLSLEQILALHAEIMAESHGSIGVREMNLLESAIAQPRAGWGDQEFYPTLAEKAAVLCYSFIKNHPFIDGNKRIGNDAMELFLDLNGYELVADVDEQEQVILQVAASQMERDDFTAWVAAHIVERT